MTTPAAADAAHLLPALDKVRRSRRLWRILFFLALMGIAAALAGRFALDPGKVGDGIARIDLNGTIATDRARREAIAKLAGDDAVKAVIVSINSPGGTTVVAVVNELGASAAYMTAIAADRVFVRRLSIIGSIGVLYQHVNAGKLLETVGIDFDKVATGPLKAEPEIDAPMSPEVRASLQSLVNDSFDWFVDIVAERRGLDRARVLELADGRIVTGRTGIALGLADAVGGETEAIAWLEAERGVAHDLPVRTAYPLPASPFPDVGRWLGGQARAAFGLRAEGPIALDGLVSLWQVGSAF
jgi:protease-4